MSDTSSSRALRYIQMPNGFAYLVGPVNEARADNELPSAYVVAYREPENFWKIQSNDNVNRQLVSRGDKQLGLRLASDFAGAEIDCKLSELQPETRAMVALELTESIGDQRTCREFEAFLRFADIATGELGRELIEPICRKVELKPMSEVNIRVPEKQWRN
jgi:hypothetical protein